MCRLFALYEHWFSVAGGWSMARVASIKMKEALNVRCLQRSLCKATDGVCKATVVGIGPGEGAGGIVRGTPGWPGRPPGGLCLVLRVEG